MFGTGLVIVCKIGLLCREVGEPYNSASSFLNYLFLIRDAFGVARLVLEVKEHPGPVPQLQYHPKRDLLTPKLFRAVERLNEASFNLSSLLDQPFPRIGSPDLSAREYSGEAEVNRRRAKRRKLDPDHLSAGHLRGFSYGYRGQVLPGPLKMEIVSCDGGLHTEAARHGREYLPENVLHNDRSVYCTDSNKCNLILRHMGETTFCLKKLVIKAPARGFTAP